MPWAIRSGSTRKTDEALAEELVRPSARVAMSLLP